MKRGFVVALLLLALVPGACSNGGDSDAPTTTQTVPSTETSAPTETTQTTAAVEDPATAELDDLRPAFLEETRALEVQIRELLGGYDRAALPPHEQEFHDLYAWYLDQLIAGHPYAYHDSNGSSSCASKLPKPWPMSSTSPISRGRHRRRQPSPRRARGSSRSLDQGSIGRYRED